MNYIKIEDMSLADIVLGTDGYGERIDTDTSIQLMQEYIDNGGNVIDTARLYTKGVSEEIIGNYLAENNLRNSVYISTKCAHPPLDDMSKHRLTMSEIESDIDKSLIALKTDVIDIMWLHRDCTDVDVAYIIDIMNTMVKKGKIRHFGASNWTHDRITLANTYADATGQKGFCASQILYNMATCNDMWDKTLVVAQGEEKRKYDISKIPVFAFCSQAKGFFEKYHTNSLSQKAIDRYSNDDTIATYHQIAERAKNSGNTISHTALCMLREQSMFPLLSIIGPSNVGQLMDTLNIEK